jgi:hypothetical protein
MTRREPPSRRACAQADRVAPVVQTSSMSSACLGQVAAAHIVGGFASRSHLLRPTCRRPRPRRRQSTSGSCARSARASAISSAGSKPRQRQRQGPAGTGTTAPPSSCGGSARSMAAAASPARDNRRPNLRPRTSPRAGPSNGEAATARSRPGGPRSITRGAVARSRSQRSQRTASGGQPVPQAAHSGGATSETRVRRCTGPAFAARSDEGRADAKE